MTSYLALDTLFGKVLNPHLESIDEAIGGSLTSRLFACLVVLGDELAWFAVKVSLHVVP